MQLDLESKKCGHAFWHSIFRQRAAHTQDARSKEEDTKEVISILPGQIKNGFTLKSCPIPLFTANKQAKRQAVHKHNHASRTLP